MKNSNIWVSASLSGLFLALVTIVITIIQSVLPQTGIISTLLWIVRLVGTIWLLYYLMKKYSAENNLTTYGENFKYGFLICLFSSIVCSCYLFLHYSFIFPEQIETITDSVYQSIAAANMTSEQEDVFVSIMGNLPKYVLVFTAIYYLLCGVIFSSIIANYTKAESTPFDTVNN